MSIDPNDIFEIHTPTEEEIKFQDDMLSHREPICPKCGIGRVVCPSGKKALRKNLCKIENCDKNDITGATVKSRSNFLQYTTDTVICQDTSAISLMEWSAAEWNQADSRRLSRAYRDT